MKSAGNKNWLTSIEKNPALFKKLHPTQKLLIFPKADILVPLESNLSCLALVGVFCLDIWGYYRLGYTKPAMQGKVNLRNPRFLKRAISVLFFSLFSSFQYRFTRWYVKFTDDWFEPWTNCKINLGYCPFKNPLNLQTMEWGQSWPLRTLFWCTTCAGMRPRGSLTSSPSGA